MRRRLPLQAAILAVCAVAVGMWAWHFPYPSPLVKPFLPANLRWPTAQVVEWAKQGNADADFLAYFMRDPERTIPAGNNIVAPADGTVLGLHEKDGVRYVVISLSVWDVHVARSPFDATVTAIEEGGVPGGSREPPLYWLDGKLAPAFKRIDMQTPHGPAVLYLITSLLSTRIELGVEPGAPIAKGQRIGRMLFGSTAVLGVPARYTFDLEMNQRVVGGETVIVDLDAAAAGG